MSSARSTIRAFSSDRRVNGRIVFAALQAVDKRTKSPALKPESAHRSKVALTLVRTKWINWSCGFADFG
jgi:hypothetical protein